jgi:isoaspartyl peptidase/L-asparaginase-like protein (Ntn-hydrolase superfamily)
MIATWRMALEGVTEAAAALASGADTASAVVNAVAAVEDFPLYKSVGYGGLPTENGEVELDAAFMHGDTLAFGAVGNLVDIANPVKVAHALSRQRYNSLLVGQGARVGHKPGIRRQSDADRTRDAALPEALSRNAG